MGRAGAEDRNGRTQDRGQGQAAARALPEAESMRAKPRKGERVAWDTSQGETTGRIVRKLTTKTRIKGYTAKPTKDAPQYLVRSDKSGKKAAHKASELRKKAS